MDPILFKDLILVILTIVVTLGGTGIGVIVANSYNFHSDRLVAILLVLQKWDGYPSKVRKRINGIAGGNVWNEFECQRGLLKKNSKLSRKLEIIREEMEKYGNVEDKLTTADEREINKGQFVAILKELIHRRYSLYSNIPFWCAVGVILILVGVLIANVK